MSTFFFFNDTATTEIYTLSLHDALPISTSPARIAITVMTTRSSISVKPCVVSGAWFSPVRTEPPAHTIGNRSEEHTSELQSRSDLVCRLLLEKKKKPIQLA